EPRVPLRLAQVLELVAQLVERLRALVHQAHVDEAIAEPAPEEVLERQVVDALDVALVVRVLGVEPALDHAVADGERQGDVGLPLRVHVPWQLGQGELEMRDAPASPSSATRRRGRACRTATPAWRQ